MVRRFVRFAEMQERGYFANRMAAWRAVRSGFPAPYELGKNTLAWDLDEVEAYVATLPRRVPETFESLEIYEDTPGVWREIISGSSESLLTDAKVHSAGLVAETFFLATATNRIPTRRLRTRPRWGFPHTVHESQNDVE
jgi:hypothetical protein